MMQRTSYYVRGSGISYADHLQAQQYIDHATKGIGQEVAFVIKHSNRELVASNKSLEDNLISFKMMEMDRMDAQRDEVRKNTELQQELGEQLTQGLDEGFERLSYSLDDLSQKLQWGMKALGSKFDWARNNMMIGMKSMQNSLEELKNLVKNPMMTAALEHFEAARNNYRRKLYKETLDELDAAINGVPGVSAGYNTEWRFHQLVGTIRMGFVGGDFSLLNLDAAEQSFLLAARYAEHDYKQEAATAYLSAGWAAYCNDKPEEAMECTLEATKLDSDLAEAWYQLAKISLSNDDLGGLDYLHNCFIKDSTYALKVLSDNDFLKHEKAVKEFIKKECKNLYNLLETKFWNKIRATPELHDITGVSPILKDCLGDRLLVDYNKAFWKVDRFLKLLENEYIQDKQELHKTIEEAMRNKEIIDSLLTDHAYLNKRIKTTYKELCKDISNMDAIINSKQFFYHANMKEWRSALEKKTIECRNILHKNLENHFNPIIEDLETAEKEEYRKLESALHSYNMTLQHQHVLFHYNHSAKSYYEQCKENITRDNNSEEDGIIAVSIFLYVIILALALWLIPGTWGLIKRHFLHFFWISLLIMVAIGAMFSNITLKFQLRRIEPIDKSEKMYNAIVKKRGHIDAETKATLDQIKSILSFYKPA